MKYEMTWRNKFLTIDAEDHEDVLGYMAKALEDAAESLRKMKKTGKVVYLDGAGDDYATFGTNDPEIAREFGFEEAPSDE